ncbi:MAG: DUF721 domain-containing protein [Acidobacteria bacterium]|nr:DUF721 domain-containing protein [Acidobacteriota bacterium]
MERVFGTIPVVLSGLGLNDSATEAVVFVAWRQTAGEMLSERTSPVEFFESRLVIAVEDRTWQRHLEDLAPQMLAQLNGKLGQGTVKFIEFRIAPASLAEAKENGREIRKQRRREPRSLRRWSMRRTISPMNRFARAS